MGTKLYVGGLSWDTTNDGLQAAFSQAGAVVSAVVISDKMSGRSKGFGFVEMATPEDAQKAIEMWHEKELEGRKIIVNEARPMTDRPRSFSDRPHSGGSGGYGGGGGGGGGYRGGSGGGGRSGGNDRRGGGNW